MVYGAFTDLRAVDAGNFDGVSECKNLKILLSEQTRASYLHVSSSGKDNFGPPHKFGLQECSVLTDKVQNLRMENKMTGKHCLCCKDIGINLRAFSLLE